MGADVAVAVQSGDLHTAERDCRVALHAPCGPIAAAKCPSISVYPTSVPNADDKDDEDVVQNFECNSVLSNAYAPKAIPFALEC